MWAEKTRPVPIEHLPSFRAQKLPGVEQMLLISVFDLKHGFSVAIYRNYRKYCHMEKNLSREDKIFFHEISAF